MSGKPSARDRLIVALDAPSVADAEALIARLGDSVTFYKIGYQLALAGGLDLARSLVSERKRVFLDMKMHDIENTVARGVESASRLGVDFLTVHGYPQTMRAAAKAKRGSPLRILAVTVLTSYDDADLKEAGYREGVRALVAARAAQARDIGIDGLVCSAEEAAHLRPIVGTDMILVTPGVRFKGDAAGDQKRVMDPSSAIRAGADYLVVGRPISAAADPKAIAETIVSEITRVMQGV